MRLSTPLHPATILKRENRFLVRARLDGEIIQAHLANPGRLPELIYPGAIVYVQPADNPERKTAWDVVLVKRGRSYCCLDTRLANAAFHEALLNRQIPEFAGYPDIAPEQTYGNSRLDFILSCNNNIVAAENPADGGGATSHKTQSRRVLIEVKSVSLVIGKHAFFPDAPTTRGAKHVRELAEASRKGEYAWIVFVCQRRDPQSVSPNEETDPDFARALREARDAGVHFMALTCQVTPKVIRVVGRIPVCMDGQAIG